MHSWQVCKSADGSHGQARKAEEKIKVYKPIGKMCENGMHSMCLAKDCRCCVFNHSKRSTIEVEPAPRPDHDEVIWIENKFKECDSCADKPGGPFLCGGCLNNRQVIGQLLAGEKVCACEGTITHPECVHTFNNCYVRVRN